MTEVVPGIGERLRMDQSRGGETQELTAFIWAVLPLVAQAFPLALPLHRRFG
jgi:hypothetical protein